MVLLLALMITQADVALLLTSLGFAVVVFFLFCPMGAMGLLWAALGLPPCASCSPYSQLVGFSFKAICK